METVAEESATGHKSKPDESNPQPHILIISDKF
jgi:hypothetical protein